MYYQIWIPLGLPLVIVGGVVTVYILGYLSIWWSLLAGIILVALYIFGLSWFVGLFDTCHAEVRERGPALFYYRSYQGLYREVTVKFYHLLSDAEQKILFAHKAAYFGLYWDDPRTLVDAGQSRCCIGYILPVDATAEVLGMLQRIGCSVLRLPLWTAVEASMTARSLLTYSISPMKLLPLVFAHVMEHYPQCLEGGDKGTPTYSYMLDKETVHGLVVSEERHLFAQLTPYPPPPYPGHTLLDPSKKTS